MPKVVVTGATGNIGTSLVEQLTQDPRVEEVVAVARRVPAPEARLDGVRYRAVDVANDRLEPVVEGADAVVHLAWLFQPSHDQVVTWNANAVGSARLFQAVAATGVPRLVHSSSVGAYSPGPDRLVDESWPTHSTPTAAYGREKAYVERVLDAVEARNPDLAAVRLRPGFIFQRRAGTEQRRLFAGPFVPRALLKRGRIPVLPVPQGLSFQTLHARDAARAFLLAALGDARGAFNVASDPVIDAAVLGEVMGARTVTVPRAAVRGAVAAAWHVRAAPTEPSLLDLFLSLPLMDTTRARTELGWSPTVTGTDALREALDGMAEGAGGDTPPLAPDSLAGRVDEVATGVGGE